MKYFHHSFLVLIIIFYFSGCSYLKLLSFKPPELKTITKVTLEKSTLTRADLRVTVEVTNRNDFNAVLKSAEYDVFLDGVYLGKGKNDSAQVLSNNSNSKLDFPVSVNLFDALRNGLNFMSLIGGNQDMLYKAEGKATVQVEGINNDFEVPFRIENKINSIQNK